MSVREMRIAARSSAVVGMLIALLALSGGPAVAGERHRVLRHDPCAQGRHPAPRYHVGVAGMIIVDEPFGRWLRWRGLCERATRHSSRNRWDDAWDF